MIVTDLGESGKRADALGKLGLSYGVGMVVGPMIGGLITKHLGSELLLLIRNWIHCSHSLQENLN